MIKFETVKKTHLSHTFVNGACKKDFTKAKVEEKKPKFEEETNGSNYYEATT